MADERVQISYEVFVKGVEQLADLKRRNEELQAQAETYKQKLDEGTKAHERQDSALSNARRSILSFRKELFAITFTAAAVIGTLKLLSLGSEELASKMEKAGDATTSFFGKIGDLISKGLSPQTTGVNKMGGIFNTSYANDASRLEENLTRATRIQRLGIQTQIELLKGNEVGALEKQQAAERIKILQDENKEKVKIFGKYLDEKHALERRDLELTMMGLKNQAQIMNDFKKNLIGGAFQGSTQSVLEKTLSGEHQTGADVLKTFQQGIARAVSEAISQSFWSSLMGGGGFGDFFSNIKNFLTGRSPQVIAAEKSAKASEDISSKNSEMLAVLRQIAECTCSTARSIGGGFVGTITPPNSSGIQKALTISNSISSLGGFGGGGSPLPPNIIMAPPMPNSSGNWVPSFPSGGEVGISAQPGEFVVRRSVAQQNKEMLHELNAGGKPAKGTTNVFYINANDASSFAMMLSSPSAQAQMEIGIIRAIMANGNLRNIIRDFAR